MLGGCRRISTLLHAVVSTTLYFASSLPLPDLHQVSHALPGGGGTAASKKLRVAAGGSASSTGATGFVGAPCSSKAAKFGIAAYFGKQ